ncbi:hypothetical protein ACFE04_030044 [Oxalis oulophora]
MACLKLGLRLHQEGNDPEKTLAFANRALNALEKDGYGYLNRANRTLGRLEGEYCSVDDLRLVQHVVQLEIAYVKTAMGQREEELSKELGVGNRAEIDAANMQIALGKYDKTIATLHGVVQQTDIDSETRRTLDLLKKLSQEQHSEGSVLQRLGRLLLLTGKVQEPIPYLENAEGRLKESFGPKSTIEPKVKTPAARTLDENIHLLLPALIRLFIVDASVDIRRAAIKLLTRLIPRVQRLNRRFLVEVISDPLNDMENDPYEDGSDMQRQLRGHHVNDGRLRAAGEASQRSSREDWAEWMRHFSIELLKESPYPALRTCARIAQLQPFIGRELFASGFVSCWSQLNEGSQRLLVRSLEMAFSSPNIPPEILATLLNLAEFMEHDEKPLPIDIHLLGALAEKCRAFAKALQNKEIEFQGCGWDIDLCPVELGFLMKPAICNVPKNDNACVKVSLDKKNEHEIAGVIEEMHEDNLRKSRFGPLSMFIIQEDLSEDFEKKVGVLKSFNYG